MVHETSTHPTTDQVIEILFKAVDQLKLSVPMDQANVKPVVVVMLDMLVGLVYGREDPLPWLYTNTCRDLETIGALRHTRMYHRETMLDVAVYRGSTDPYITLATAESEASHQHEVLDSSTTDTSDYLWDLFKLLQVPSPVRLYVARASGVKKCQILESRVEFVVKGYQECLREQDRLYSIVLPTASRDYSMLRCAGWVKQNSSLKEL